MSPHRKVAATPAAITASAAILLASAASAAAAPSFSLASAAIPGDNNLPFDISLTNATPDINNNRDIAVNFLDANANDGIFITRNGIGATVRLTPAVATDPRINNNADAVWYEFFGPEPEGVWGSLNNSSASNLVTPGPLGTNSISTPQIDDQQRVAFRASFGGNAQALTILDNGSFNTVATTSAADPASPFSFIYTPRFNNQNQIAAKVDTGPTAGSPPEQIRLFNADGSSTLIAANNADAPGSIFQGSFDNSVDANDNAQVVFTARDTSIAATNADAVVVGDANTTTIIASTLDPDISNIQFFAPAISASGLAAFIADDATGNESIFAGDGNHLIKVVTTGDAIDTPLGTKFIAPDALSGSLAMNDQGDIAFSAFLNNADGSPFGRVIAIANIPAPASAALITLPALAAARRRR